MKEQPNSEHTGPGRPRSESSKAAVLHATTELLKSTSLRELTIDAIAKQAKVGKFTIYRWWPTKAHVALEAVLQTMKTRVLPIDTGSTERDFQLHLRSVIRFYKTSIGQSFRQLLTEGQNDPAFAKTFLEDYLMPRRELVAAMWQRGVERGDVRADIDVDVAIDLISGPMIYRLLSGAAPLNDSEADALISAVFLGLNAPSAKSKKNGKN